AGCPRLTGRTPHPPSRAASPDRVPEERQLGKVVLDRFDPPSFQRFASSSDKPAELVHQFSIVDREQGPTTEVLDLALYKSGRGCQRSRAAVNLDGVTVSGDYRSQIDVVASPTKRCAPGRRDTEPFPYLPREMGRCRERDAAPPPFPTNRRVPVEPLPLDYPATVGCGN